tara:strand:+ start:95 stop:328 length:234 start_codon:yes stop_codon:yes gene_type:complete
MNWRDEIQQEIDISNALRSASIIRVGDSQTETKKNEEGVGRSRECIRDNSKRIEDAIDGQSLKAALFADHYRNYGSV